MASDPMQLFGLYLDMKRRREQSAQNQQQMAMQQQRMAMQQDQLREGALARAIEVASQTGDSKLATGLLEASQGGMSRQQDWDLVDAAAKNARKQMKAAEEKAAANAATPNDAAQTDFARGIAAQIERTDGDPLQNVLGGLRGLPPNMPPEMANQIVRRGGSIAGEQNRAGAEFDRRKVMSTDEWIRGNAAARGGAGGKPPTEAAKNTAADRKNASQSAWEKFTTSEADWKEWIIDAPRPDVVAAMRHPEYAKMRAKAKQRPLGFSGVEAGASSGASKADAGEWVDLGGGVRARKKQ